MRSPRTFERLVGLAALIDTADRAGGLAIGNGSLRVPVVILGVPLPTPDVPTPVVAAVAMVWVGGALLMAAGVGRVGAAGLLLGSGAALAVDQQNYSNHTFLIWSLAALIVIAGSSSPWLLGLTVRSQISIVYIFAALSKIRDPWWSGEILRRSADGIVGLVIARDLPDRSLVALAVWIIGVECALAALVWWEHGRTVALTAAVAFHGGVIAVVGNDLGLVVFALAMLSHFALPPREPAPRATTTDMTSIPPSGSLDR